MGITLRITFGASIVDLQLKLTRWGLKLISYITGGGLILFGCLYIGLTRGFAAGRSLRFLAVVWVFVFIAIQSNWVKAPSRTARFPFTNLNGLSEIGNRWWWIRNAGTQRHVRTPGMVVRNPGFQNGPQM